MMKHKSFYVTNFVLTKSQLNGFFLLCIWNIQSILLGSHNFKESNERKYKRYGMSTRYTFSKKNNNCLSLAWIMRTIKKHSMTMAQLQKTCFSFILTYWNFNLTLLFMTFFFKLLSFHFKLPILLFLYTTDNIIQLTEYCIMPVANKCN